MAKTSHRSGRGGRPSLPFAIAGEVVIGWRWCGRVRTADRAEERRGTGEEVGGILRPVPLFSFALPVLFVPLLFPSVLAFVLPLYIIRYIYNKNKATN